MNYLVTKKRGDGRAKTCGLWIPDGFSVVVELTHARIKQLENLKKFGYNVEESDIPTSGKPRIFNTEGDEVSYESVIDYHVHGSPPIQRIQSDTISRSEEPPKEVEDRSLENEIDMLRIKLDEQGIKYRKDAGAEALKRKLASA